MTDPVLSFKPIVKPDAGSQIGISYMKEFVKCPRRWFFKYAMETEQDDGSVAPTGIELKGTAVPLISGSNFHAGMESYYRSGCRDGADTGEYKLDAAIAGFEESFNRRKRDYVSADVATEDYDMVKTMLVAYSDRYGPTSSSPDYPNIEVLCDQDTGEPMVEREFTTLLGYGNYYMTSKIDVIIAHMGFVKGFEHKTSVASYIRSRLMTSHNDAQMSGEILSITESLPPAYPFHGILVNVVGKKRSPRSKYDIAERETTTRTQSQQEDFKQSCIDVLRQIDDRVANFNEWTRVKGIPFHQALAVWFPATGYFNDECNSYNRLCDFAPICSKPAASGQMLNAFRPRTRVEKPVNVETAPHA